MPDQEAYQGQASTLDRFRSIAAMCSPNFQSKSMQVLNALRAWDTAVSLMPNGLPMVAGFSPLCGLQR